MILCEYGCGKEAKHQFKNGKWCCKNHHTRCSLRRKNVEGKQNPFYGKTHTIENLKKNIQFNKGRKQTKESKELKRQTMLNHWNDPEYRRKIIKSHFRRTIKYIKEKYPTFAKIEEMRYEPGKEKVIQVHCKNHKCKNSKEQGEWFIPSGRQLEQRISSIENGNGGGYLYCCDECKNICPLFNLQSDPFQIEEKLYTPSEYQIFRQNVLERENYLCEYCEEKATIVHHSRPQKLEPGFVLDPDFGIACCEKHHYQYGHKDECSTGKIAKIVCNVKNMVK